MKPYWTWCSLVIRLSACRKSVVQHKPHMFCVLSVPKVDSHSAWPVKSIYDLLQLCHLYYYTQVAQKKENVLTSEQELFLCCIFIPSSGQEERPHLAKFGSLHSHDSHLPPWLDFFCWGRREPSEGPPRY